MISFFVPGLPKSPNQIGRSHWAIQAREKRQWQETIGWLAKSVKTSLHPLKMAHIVIQIQVGNNRRVDPDNLAWACTKPLLDSIKGVLIEDDSIDNISLEYHYSRAKPKGFLVTVS